MIFFFQVYCPYLRLPELSVIVSPSGRLDRLGLSSEVSLPPVSKLCEEFDCVPAAGAAACPAKENALSLLSSSVICCKVRGYPLVGSGGDLRLITCESDVPADIYICCGYLEVMVDDKEYQSFRIALFRWTSASVLDLSQRGIIALSPYGWRVKIAIHGDMYYTL